MAESQRQELMGSGMDVSRPADDTVHLRLYGSWKMHAGLPPSADVLELLTTDPAIRRLTFDTTGLTGWDSGLLTFLLRILDYCTDHNLEADRSGLPDGVRRLLTLASAVPEKTDTRQTTKRPSLVARLGEQALNVGTAAADMLRFLGESALAGAALVRGRARFRQCDFALTVQECGAQALGIVSLISFLIGLILAFVGAIQLQQFGAQIYVADLVGIGMAREMGAMMTAIIMAGRTGAAFAAQLGTMTVNEEVDALRTLGISPMEFLVLPRMSALALMMPLLCLYADLVGMLGGLVVGTGMLDLSFTQYVNETIAAVSLADIVVGVSKSVVFGILVALSGCLRGMQCGRSSAAVGIAATSAVVTAIVLIIMTDAVFAVVTNEIGV